MSKSGGSAFPALNFVVPQNLSDEGVQRLGETQGMSLRDYFAAKAMQGMLANLGGPIQENPQTGWGYTNCDAADVAATAYEAADAMIAEREK